MIGTYFSSLLRPDVWHPDVLRHVAVLFLALLSPIFAEEAGPHKVPKVTPEVTLIGVGKTMLSIADQVVTKQLKLAGDSKASGPLADDLAFFLESRYRQDGYPEVHVEWKLEGEGMVLTVVEGPIYEVGQLTIEGADEAVTSTLLPYLTSPTKERRARKEKHLPYVAEELKSGASMVERKLRADGFLDAVASEPTFTPNAETKTMDVTVKVTPGQKYTFGEVRLTGEIDDVSEPLRERISQLKGQSFNEVSLESLRKDLVTDCQARGYFSPVVTSENNFGRQSNHEISATLNVQLGEIYRVREIHISEDFSKGARHVANSIFHPAEDERYGPISLDLYTRRALETGIYGRLDVTPRVTGPGDLTLDIAGTEAKPITLSLYGGYETFAGIGVGTELRNANFLDSGHTASVKAEWSFRGLEGRLGWKDPAIFGTRNALAVDLYAETFEFKAYERKTAALRASLSRRFSKATTAEIFTGIYVNGVTSTALLPSELGPDSYTMANVGARLYFDYRDNPLIPHKGWQGSLGVEANAGEVSFTKFDFMSAFYQPITQRLRMAIGARASYIQTSSDITELPIDLRNFNGGGTSVRSFKDREMGEHSILGANPLGDFAFTVVNAELSYEIISNLEVAAFVDAGTLGDGKSLFSFDGMRYGVGLGVRYNLPIGPLRVDYGFNPDQREGEAQGAIHVTFGFAF
jgi:outer membrane protein insertion porin family